MTDCITYQTKPSMLVRVISYFRTRAQQRQNRAAFQCMLDLDPAILKDIGVTRGNVIWANNLPVEINAAQELEKIRARNPMSL